MTYGELLGHIKAARKEQTWTSFAAALGVGRTNLMNVVSKRRMPSDELLERMGLEKIVTYRKRKD